QAEDGIRDFHVTGVQTCALPIYALIRRTALESINGYQPGLAEDLATSLQLQAAGWHSVYVPHPLAPGLAPPDLAAWFVQQFKWRSEERRVGKECRSGWSGYH